MRIPALVILTIATVLTAAPARAQNTIRLIRFACMCTAGGPIITNAATRRFLSATRRHRAAPPSASIHILRARKCPLGGIAASTKLSLGLFVRRAAPEVPMSGLRSKRSNQPTDSEGDRNYNDRRDSACEYDANRNAEDARGVRHSITSYPQAGPSGIDVPLNALAGQVAAF
jgi:hypothetical protein